MNDRLATRFSTLKSQTIIYYSLLLLVKKKRFIHKITAIQQIHVEVSSQHYKSYCKTIDFIFKTTTTTNTTVIIIIISIFDSELCPNSFF